MGGEDDAELLLGDGLHQVLQELPPGQRVEAGHRLVEDEQLRPLGDGRGSGRAGRAGRRRACRPSASGPGRARRSASWARPSSQPRVEPGAEAQVVGDGQARVGRGVLRDEADLGQLRRAGRRAAAEDLDRARGRGQQCRPPGCSSVRLARAVRADQPDHPARRGCPACSRTAPSGARTACPAPRPAGRRLTLCPLLGGARKVVGRAPRCSRRPARPARALASQRAQVLSQRAVRGERLSARVRVTNVPSPGPGGDQPLVLELAVGLEHRVRVDRHLADDLLDGRQLVALAQQPQPQRLAHLLDELQVGETPERPSRWNSITVTSISLGT